MMLMNLYSPDVFAKENKKMYFLKAIYSIQLLLFVILYYKILYLGLLTQVKFIEDSL